MKKCCALLIALIGMTSLLSAETNALIEVKLFKDWVIKNDLIMGNLAIKNTGTFPLRLAKDAFDFSSGQLETRSLPNRHGGYIDAMYETNYKMIAWGDGDFFDLLPEETHVYEGRKFYLPARNPFSEEMRFVVSIYLGSGFWLDSEPVTVKGIIPDSAEELPTVKDNTRNLQDPPRKMTAITYKNERWLYYANVYPICPLSLTNKVRIEPHDGAGLFKIWDGDNAMIFDMYRGGVIVEGSDEHDVLGKWTRERKQKAEADNAEVRRKKAEEAQ